MKKKYIDEKILTRYMNSIGYKIVNVKLKDIKTKSERNVSVYSNLEGICTIECLGDKFLGAYINNGCYISFNKAQDHYYGNGFNDNNQNPYISPQLNSCSVLKNENEKLYIEIENLIDWIGITSIKHIVYQSVIEMDLEQNTKKINLLCQSIIFEIKKIQEKLQEDNIDNSNLHAKLLSIYNNLTNNKQAPLKYNDKKEDIINNLDKKQNKEQKQSNNNTNNFIKKININEQNIENPSFTFDDFLNFNNVDKMNLSVIELQDYYRKYRLCNSIGNFIIQIGKPNQ